MTAQATIDGRLIDFDEATNTWRYLEFGDPYFGEAEPKHLSDIAADVLKRTLNMPHILEEDEIRAKLALETLRALR